MSTHRNISQSVHVPAFLLASVAYLTAIDLTSNDQVVSDQLDRIIQELELEFPCATQAKSTSTPEDLSTGSMTIDRADSALAPMPTPTPMTSTPPRTSNKPNKSESTVPVAIAKPMTTRSATTRSATTRSATTRAATTRSTTTRSEATRYASLKPVSPVTDRMMSPPPQASNKPTKFESTVRTYAPASRSARCSSPVPAVVKAVLRPSQPVSSLTSTPDLSSSWPSNASLSSKTKVVGGANAASRSSTLSSSIKKPATTSIQKPAKTTSSTAVVKATVMTSTTRAKLTDTKTQPATLLQPTQQQTPTSDLKQIKSNIISVKPTPVAPVAPVATVATVATVAPVAPVKKPSALEIIRAKRAAEAAASTEPSKTARKTIDTSARQSIEAEVASQTVKKPSALETIRAKRLAAAAAAASGEPLEPLEPARKPRYISARRRGRAEDGGPYTEAHAWRKARHLVIELELDAPVAGRSSGRFIVKKSATESTSETEVLKSVLKVKKAKRSTGPIADVPKPEPTHNRSVIWASEWDVHYFDKELPVFQPVRNRVV
ncbi:hypothetical protein CF327_g6895 [Tilletia walkeri]|uniref:Uncharacterized protein n=1 Tax=Tilletia walkeri TaxID=117179 RepID=A0A8X7N3T4_9BASI|nr:hypothetical protein CF327_g6895 [Tilletia walkeri]KAE8265969.1 hypothetical protein A4X09_0g6379 [Tilletia walkeri]